MKNVFIAYPARPQIIGDTIEAAAAFLRTKHGNQAVVTWRRDDLAGNPVLGPIVDAIESAEFVAADISNLNFNVTYEIGYALGLGKRVLPLRCVPVQPDGNIFQQLGLYDTLLYENYENSDQLIRLLEQADSGRRFATDFPADPAPVFTVLPLMKTDLILHMRGRIPKAGFRFRSFDPAEQPRLSATDAIRAVAASHGVILPLLPPEFSGALDHNTRVAFVAGVAHALQKVTLILQLGSGAAPLDVRDDVVIYQGRDDGHDSKVFQKFAERVNDSRFSTSPPEAREGNRLAILNLGDSIAENEETQLSEYFLEREEYRQVLAGRAHIVVGRKGSGKTAVFSQVRDHLKSARSQIVVDLSPESYQLRKLKDVVLKCLAAGSKEHLLAAFWEYVLLLEICSKILEKDVDVHKRNHKLFEPYNRLLMEFKKESASEGSNFSDRLVILVSRISDDYYRHYGDKQDVSLAEGQVTNLLYKTSLSNLRKAIEVYSEFKDGIFVLFDNLDKSWNASGLDNSDVIMIRTLIDASRKLERSFSSRRVNFHCVVFLRNDIYETLIAQTADRGKETRVLVDWVQSDLLKQVIRRRLIANGYDKNMNIEEMWHQLCGSALLGEDSLSYLVDRSLMRPRYLIRLINYCKGNAINFGRDRIDDDDITQGLSTYSTDIVTEIDLEIGDVFPPAKDILYEFLAHPREMPRSRIIALIENKISDTNVAFAVFSLLLWHGVFGLRKDKVTVSYIHDVNYDIKRLNGLIGRAAGDPTIVINPALWPGLELE